MISLILTIALLISTLVLLTQAIDLTSEPTRDARRRLKLEILNSSGTPIATAYSDYGNLEILQLNNPTAGTYKIRVTLESNSTKQVNFAVAWW